MIGPGICDQFRESTFWSFLLFLFEKNKLFKSVYKDRAIFFSAYSEGEKCIRTLPCCREKCCKQEP